MTVDDERLEGAVARFHSARREILNLAALATEHRKVVGGDWCSNCHEQHPCSTVMRAAGPALDAVAADLLTTHTEGAARVKAAVEAALSRDMHFASGHTVDTIAVVAANVRAALDASADAHIGRGV